jgi:hypothetical protein
MAKSKRLSSKDEMINLLASQYPRSLSNNFLDKGFVNDLIVDMSYGEAGLEKKVKDLGLNILIDTKRTPVGEVRGFRGQMFVDSEYNIYVAIRGTSSDGVSTLLNNVSTDLSVIASGEFDKEYSKELNDFIKKVRDYSDSLPEAPKIYVHGHSLGGGAAQHAGLLLSMTAQKEQSIMTLTSDPIATEELSNKAIAAYKKLKSGSDRVIKIDELIEKINSKEINSIVDKYFSREEYDRYQDRQTFIAEEFGSKCRIINLIPAEKHEKKLYFSSAALIHRQPGVSVISIRDAQVEEKVKPKVAQDQSLVGSITRSVGSIFSSGFSYADSKEKCEEVVDRVTGLVENVMKNVSVHNFSELMKATQFVAIDDSTLIHKRLTTQLSEKFENNIDLNFLIQNSVSIENAVGAERIELAEQEMRNKMNQVLRGIDPSIQASLRNVEESKGAIVPAPIPSNPTKVKAVERR